MKTSRKLNRKNNKRPQFTAKQNQDVADKISIDKIGCIIITAIAFFVIGFVIISCKF